jgi:hypothetical protein
VRRRGLLFCAALLVACGAGCGGSRHPAETTAARLPRSLAQTWAARADAIAAAASAGHSCRARSLAGSLRDDVVNADTHVPAAYRTALLVSVNQLADRIVCVPPTKTVTMPAQPPPPPGQQQHHDDHPKPPKHDHPGPAN